MQGIEAIADSLLAVRGKRVAHEESHKGLEEVGAPHIAVIILIKLKHQLRFPAKLQKRLQCKLALLIGGCIESCNLQMHGGKENLQLHLEMPFEVQEQIENCPQSERKNGERLSARVLQQRLAYVILDHTDQLITSGNLVASGFQGDIEK